MLGEMEKIASEKGDEWKRQAHLADVLEAAVASTHYQTIDDEIFKEIEREAFATIKSPDLDMTNLNELYQFRALCQAVDLIRKRIHQKIAQGKNARLYLKQLNSTPKEESNG